MEDIQEEDYTAMSAAATVNRSQTLSAVGPYLNSIIEAIERLNDLINNIQVLIRNEQDPTRQVNLMETRDDLRRRLIQQEELLRNVRSSQFILQRRPPPSVIHSTTEGIATFRYKEDQPDEYKYNAEDHRHLLISYNIGDFEQTNYFLFDTGAPDEIMLGVKYIPDMKMFRFLLESEMVNDTLLKGKITFFPIKLLPKLVVKQRYKGISKVIIDSIPLMSDEDVHTIRTIFEAMYTERGFDIGYNPVLLPYRFDRHKITIKDIINKYLNKVRDLRNVINVQRLEASICYIELPFFILDNEEEIIRRVTLPE